MPPRAAGQRDPSRTLTHKVRVRSGCGTQLARTKMEKSPLHLAARQVSTVKPQQPTLLWMHPLLMPTRHTQRRPTSACAQQHPISYHTPNSFAYVCGTPREKARAAAHPPIYDKAQHTPCGMAVTARVSCACASIYKQQSKQEVRCCCWWETNRLRLAAFLLLGECTTASHCVALGVRVLSA